MLTSVALAVCQVSVVDWPFWTVSGLALSDAVGAAGGGGGGGGAGTTFFLQAPSIRTAVRATTRVTHFNLRWFMVLFLLLQSNLSPAVPLLANFVQLAAQPSGA
jgi:hypothetical protein